MTTTKAEHEPAPHPLIAAGESPGPVADPQVGSFVIPIPGLVFDSRPGEVRRHSAPNDPLGGTALDPDIAGRLTSRRGRGEPLPPDVAHAMGDAMGADLNGVRIHTGSEPAELARSVQAVAFTQGADIYFSAGSYAPRTLSGQRLLAHELAHTVQQAGGSGPGGGPVIGRSDDPAEAQADRIADGALSVLRRMAARRHDTERGSESVELGGSVGPVASPTVLRACAPAARESARADGSAAVQRRPAALSTLRTVRRAPADFATTPAVGLKSGWGFLAVYATPWEDLLKAINDYALSANATPAARKGALDKMPALIKAWEDHHQVGTKTKFDDDEKLKIAALKVFKALITTELLAVADDKATQDAMPPRFRGDYLLGQVLQARATVKSGDTGPTVARVQQALADMAFLSASGVSGVFGDPTEAALQAFQRSVGVTANGVVDGPTMDELGKAFVGHAVVRALAQAPAVGAKASAGQFAWGSAPAVLSSGTRDLAVGSKAEAREAVNTSQPKGVGGKAPTFVPVLAAGSYQTRLKDLVLRLVQREYDGLAAGKAAKRDPTNLFDWAQIKIVAEHSKAATDAVFGKFAIGPPLAPGVSIHDAWETKEKALKDEASMDDAADWRVEKLLTGSPHVRRLDQEHGAIQTRGPEKAIVDQVKAEIVTAKRVELVETHKAWPAFAGGGIVNIQRFKASSDPLNRNEMWDLFQTVVHEYLHTLEHSRYRKYRATLGQQEGDFTLREGVTEYLTYTVLESVNYDDTLRAAVEGDFHDDTVRHPIPRYYGYGERVNAEKLAGVVGARNVLAAFFLGDVEKIGGTA